jgi:hypothetical protein
VHTLFCCSLFRICRKQHNLKFCSSVTNTASSQMICIINLFVRFLHLFYKFNYQYWSVQAIWSMAPSIENENSITVLASVELLTRVQASKCDAFKKTNEFIVYDLIREERRCILHSRLYSLAVCFCHGVKYIFLGK